MESRVLSAFAALTDIDDDLVLEGMEELKPAKQAKPFSAYAKYFAAAAAALVLTGGVLLAVASFGKKPAEPDDHSVFVPATGEPRPERTDAPQYSVDGTEAPGWYFEHMTPDPTFAPQEPRETAAPTAEPTAQATDGGATIAPVPTPTPQATGGTTAAPTAEPTAAVTAQPTSAPPAEMLAYNSLEAFLSAVRGHADPLLDGIDCYYTHGGTLTGISVDLDIVTYEYQLDDGTPFKLEWFKDTGYSERLFSHYTSNFEGEWHGDMYLIRSQAGVMYGYMLDGDHMLRMHGSGVRTVEQALAQYAPVRHGI